MVFLVGAAVGSFLNVCIYRLPLEKSPLWPLGSRCGKCLQPIGALDNIPLLSYWLLRGRCRTCQTSFSMRYFFIELGTALCFVGLFYLECVRNIHKFDVALLGQQRADLACLVAFIWHAILLSFLIVATFCDIDYRTIPLSLTMTGSVIGIIGAIFLPWPWPYTPAQATPTQAVPIPFAEADNWMMSTKHRPFQAVYAWPVWGPLPAWLAPGGNWQIGLATGIAGFLVGTLTLRLVRFAFGLGIGADYMEDADPESERWSMPWRLWHWAGRVGGKTLGLGDADLMMMAGAFLGWQPTLTAFFLAVVPGLFFGMVQIFQRGDNALPFGPSLAIGAMIAALGWQELGSTITKTFFFNGEFLLSIVLISTFLLVVSGYILRILKQWRG